MGFIEYVFSLTLKANAISLYYIIFFTKSNLFRA